MAKFVLKDATVSVDGVVLTDHVSDVTIETSFDEAEASTMGAVYKEILQGLGDATITVTFLQDFNAASVDATLWPLSQSGEVFPVLVKPFSGVVSALNPQYAMNSVLMNYNPLSGGIGEVANTEVNFRNATQTGLVKTIAP